jgi:hypothetical protein
VEILVGQVIDITVGEALCTEEPSAGIVLKVVAVDSDDLAVTKHTLSVRYFFHHNSYNLSNHSFPFISFDAVLVQVPLLQVVLVADGEDPLPEQEGRSHEHLRTQHVGLLLKTTTHIGGYLLLAVLKM